MSSDTAPPPELIGNLLLKALALLNLLSCLLLRFRCFLFKKSASDIWDIIMKVLPSGVFEYLFIVEVEAFPLGISNLHLGAEEYSIEPPLVSLSRNGHSSDTDTSDPAVYKADKLDGRGDSKSGWWVVSGKDIRFRVKKVQAPVCEKMATLEYSS
ncbi:hypothetical protein Bca4012_082959 [Brassica carinata]